MQETKQRTYKTLFDLLVSKDPEDLGDGLCTFFCALPQSMLRCVMSHEYVIESHVQGELQAETLCLDGFEPRQSFFEKNIMNRSRGSGIV